MFSIGFSSSHSFFVKMNCYRWFSVHTEPSSDENFSAKELCETTQRSNCLCMCRTHLILCFPHVHHTTNSKNVFLRAGYAAAPTKQNDIHEYHNCAGFNFNRRQLLLLLLLLLHFMCVRFHRPSHKRQSSSSSFVGLCSLFSLAAAYSLSLSLLV